MPSLTFVLPHWMYWSGLAVFPLLAMALARRERARHAPLRASLPIAYFLCLTGGFVGLHRFYLRSLLGLVYIPLFLAILYGNVQDRTARNELSNARNDLLGVEFTIEQTSKAIKSGDTEAPAKLAAARAERTQVERRIETTASAYAGWRRFSGAAAALIALLLLLDALRMPHLTRRCLGVEGDTVREEVSPLSQVAEAATTTRDPVAGMRLRATVAIDALNGFVGQFIAYWSVIAVFVYFYEVIARYVFNSPTNWAHESMFLMFGMQYLLAGGYALREGSHVRVDVVYLHFSDRTKAAVDVLTSVFFFIFTGTLLWTGWTFFSDSIATWEVSFTEWAIQYWTVKLAIPLGAALILLQGLAQLLKDITFLLRTPGDAGGT